VAGYLLVNDVAIGYHPHIAKKAGGHGIVVGVANNGFLAERLHQLARKTGSGIAGWYYGNGRHKYWQRLFCRVNLFLEQRPGDVEVFEN
jgi:hypothetical protein